MQHCVMEVPFGMQNPHTSNSQGVNQRLPKGEAQGLTFAFTHIQHHSSESTTRYQAHIQIGLNGNSLHLEDFKQQSEYTIPEQLGPKHLLND